VMQEKEAIDEDAKSWLSKLRRAYHMQDWRTATRIVMAMGGSPNVDEMHRVLAQEAVQLQVGVFCRLLTELIDDDLPPRHGVELYHMVEFWFRKQCPSATEWNVIVFTLVRGDCCDEALDIVQAMEQGDDQAVPPPTEYTYTSIVPMIAELQGPEAAAALLVRMGRQAIEPSFVTYLNMVCVYTRMDPPDMEMAKLWVRKAELRGAGEENGGEYVTYAYTAFMAAYARMNRMKDCFAFLGTLRARRIVPDPAAFHVLMNLCLVNSPYATQEVRQLLRMMQQVGVEPSTNHYNVLIRAYALSGQVSSAIIVANRMKDSGVPWDNVTYYFIIRGLVDASQVELALRLLAKMRKDGVRPNSRHYVVAFVGLAAAGFFEDACRVFRRLVSLKDPVSQHSYNMMIAINCRRGDMEAALEVQRQMEERGLPSNLQTYRVLLEGYAQEQDWEAIMEYVDPVKDFRKLMQDTVKNPAATVPARKEAEACLNRADNVSSWRQVFFYIIDAAVWTGRWSRAVELLEDFVEMGMSPCPKRHRRLLLETSRNVRIGPATDLMWATDNSRVFRFGEEEDKLDPEVLRRRAEAAWIREAPASLRETLGRSRGSGRQTRSLMSLRRQGRLELERRGGLPPPEPDAVEGMSTAERNSLPSLVPPHMFIASFSPDWLAGDEAEGLGSLSAILDGCLGGGEVSAEAMYQVVHDFHHATVHRRPLATLRLDPGRAAVVRTAEETLESLRTLFETFGRPGTRGAPAYVFMRPAAASLNALVALLALGAMHPKEVLLMRPYELLQQEEVRQADGMERLEEECKTRSVRSMSYSLASLLGSMPVGVLINSRLIVTNSTELKETTPRDFDEKFRQNCAIPPLYAPEAKTWSEWLSQQKLNQLVRVERGTIRLDAFRLRPAMSEAELFKVRSLTDDQVSVDLLMGEEGGVVEFLSGTG